MLNKQILISFILSISPISSIYAMDAEQDCTPKLATEQNELNTQLFNAVKGRNREQIRHLLLQNADVNAKDERGMTPLMEAATRGLDNICKILISAQAQINAESDVGATPLTCAAINRHEVICKLLLKNGAEINAQNKMGKTALLFLATKGDACESVCKLFIERGAQVDLSDNKGSTPLIRAAISGHSKICKLLLENGAQINFNHLRCAAHGGHPVALRTLITCAQFNPFPMPFSNLRQFIENKSFAPEPTIAKIKEYHFACMRPMMLAAMPDAKTPEIAALITPDNLEQNYGAEIEMNIKRRLGLAADLK